MPIRLTDIYAELKLIERSAADPASRENKSKLLAEVQTLINAIKVSSLESKLYDLKGQVNMVRERLKLDS